MNRETSVTVVEFEIQEPNMNNVKGLIRDYVADYRKSNPGLKWEKFTDVENLIRLMVLDLGLWMSKNMESDVEEVIKVVKKSTKHIKEIDEGYFGKLIEGLGKYFRLQYKDIAAWHKAQDEREAQGKQSTTTEDPKADRVLAAPTTKQEKIETLHFDLGYAPKDIATIMSLTGKRVNNALRIARKRRNEKS